MASVKYSIVVPTRDRHQTLQACLKTCIDQDCQDYEIVVCDNYSSPDTHRVVMSCNSEKIKYIRTPCPLSMTNNWELALKQASGEWLLYIGDDDGLLPNAFGQLDRMIEQVPVRAFQWEPAYYIWPNSELLDRSNYLRVPVRHHCEVKDSRQAIAKVSRFEAGYPSLPTFYHGLVHRSLVEEMYRRHPRVFEGRYPDVYTGFVVTYLAGEFASLSFPVTVVGHSPKSNGGNCIVRGSNIPEFYVLNDQDRLARHPWVDSLRVYPVTYVADSFLLAKQIFFPQDQGLVMRRPELIRLIIQCSSFSSQAEWDGLRRQIDVTLRDDASLQAWFNDYVSQFDPFDPRRKTGLSVQEADTSQESLQFDASRFGVTNIADAATVCDYVLALTKGPFPAAWPSRKALRSYRAPKAFYYVAAAEGGRLDRLGLPRPLIRVIRKVLSQVGWSPSLRN